MFATEWRSAARLKLCHVVWPQVEKSTHGPRGNCLTPYTTLVNRVLQLWAALANEAVFSLSLSLSLTLSFSLWNYHATIINYPAVNMKRFRGKAAFWGYRASTSRTCSHVLSKKAPLSFSFSHSLSTILTWLRLHPCFQSSSRNWRTTTGRTDSRFGWTWSPTSISLAPTTFLDRIIFSTLNRYPLVSLSLSLSLLPYVFVFRANIR